MANTNTTTNFRVAASEQSKTVTVKNVSKRLQQELRTLMMSNSPGISAFPQDNDIFTWLGTIEGAEGTAYDGLKYQLVLTFPPQYPLEAMHVKFVTPCFHPNVDTHGNICLDILKEKWSALYDVRTILLSIQSLLAEPNNDSPLNGHAADLWKNPTAYRKVVLEQYDKNLKGAQEKSSQMQKLS